MNPRQSVVCQDTDVRRNSKPGIVLSAVQTRMEMADLRNKDELSPQTPARTWCLAAVLCLVASITIVCTTLWATSLIGLSAVSTHQTKIKPNESELYNEDLMKQYIAKRYPELGIQNQTPVTNKNKTFVKQEKKSPPDIIVEDNIEKKIDKEKNTENVEAKRKDKDSDAVANIEIPKDVSIPNNHRTSFKEIAEKNNGKQSKLSEGGIEGQVTSISEKEFAEYAKETDLDAIGLKNPDTTKLNNALFSSLQEIFQDQLPGQPKFPDYGPNSYFYSEYDANSYYSSYDDVTWTGYILEKIQELHDWITSDVRGVGPTPKSATIPQILEALNITLLQGDISVLVLKLKDLYMENAKVNLFNETTDVTRGKDILTNTSSATSFGLLTLDILLLRNLHLLMWDNQRTAIHELLRDSEVFAMNALFMDPSKVRRIYEILQRSQSRGRDMMSEGWPFADQSLPILRDSLTSHFYAASPIGQDVIDFTFSIIRAAANLGRAFRVSRVQKHRSSGIKNSPSLMSSRERSDERHDDKSTELDCIWTVYCRNLDKATRNTGIFGFLAKLNSIGLRLIIGEIKFDRVVDVVIQETFRGSKPLNCDGIFPRCSNKNAAKIVIEGIMSTNPNTKHKSKY